MSYVNIMVHAVWRTHNHEPVLVREKREQLFQHILTNAKSKGIYIDILNGHVDHVHCLISLGADQSIGGVMKLIKGEAAHWANKEKLFNPRFVWAEDYYAVSLSKTAVGTVRNYIRNQEEHHKKKTFIAEYEEYMKAQGFLLG